MTAPELTYLAALDELTRKGRMVVRHGNKQILLVNTDKGVFACNNRCPHEGYPLSEGSLGEDCVLTCNWHNWKFDLADGANLTDGDSLRCYPVAVRDGGVHVDLSNGPAQARIDKALENLAGAFPRHEYDRMAREIARLIKAGGDPLDAVRLAVNLYHDRVQYGLTHAAAGAADWLTLAGDIADGEAERLTALVESVGHFAWDCMREPQFPYPPDPVPYDAAGLVQAIEDEDERRAIGMVRDALRQGLGYRDLEEPLSRAALAHYQDFGHSLIYVSKCGQLIDQLGGTAAQALLLALVRGLVFARREDLIPEFRGYARALAAWDGTGAAEPRREDFQTLSVNGALSRARECSGHRERLYHSLLAAAAWQLLHYDPGYQDATDGTVSQNIGWLDFTHAITFANAVRRQCSKYPDLWPAGLLQIACFLGRNSAFVDESIDGATWRVDNGDDYLARSKAALFDHGQFEYIVSCHLLKLTCAVAEEWQAGADEILLAALNRFLNSPLKRKHALRTARQSLTFVALED
jgi:nitrite reductase/ring-hydroxylating ferredoxin subunit